ncbi:MAG: SDR family oxidoreductase [Gammaproteobacteria bacterium]
MSALTGQVAIVTGAGTGIGYQTAVALAQAGAALVLAGRREAPLLEARAAVEAAGGKAIVRPTDLEDGDAAAALGQWVLQEMGRVDILVNNAGHSTSVRSIRHVSPREWDSVFKVNVEGVYRLTQSVIESMIERGSGTVVTVSSMAALQPGLLGGIPYSAAKAASLNLVHGMNAELRSHGVRACAIIPAEVNTPILDNRPSPPDAAARATMMQPEDVAGAILLCVTLPGRTTIEQIVLKPTIGRDTSAEQAVAATKSA